MKFWTWLRSNPYFVTATSAFFGALLNALYQEVQPPHSVDWSAKGLESLAATAGGAVIVALYHLYTTTPATARAKYAAQQPRLGAWVLIGLLLLGTMPVLATSACSSNELKADATTLASALTSLAGAIQTTNPSVAADLLKAATTLTAALNGTGTGPAWEQALNGAAAAAEAAMAFIPITAPFATLLSIAVAAAELIISSTTTTTQQATRVMSNPQNLLWYVRTGRPLIKHSFGRSQSGDVKAAWNAEAIKLGYATAVLK
jgi:hypothetical protein